MNRPETASTVLTILRQSSLIGGRGVDFAAPLGEQGLGLDSLALVKFITAVENHFAFELPESIWIGRERLTLKHLGEAIDGMIGPGGEETLLISPLTPSEPGANDRKGTDGIIRKAAKLCRFLAGFVYKRDTFHILEFDLERRSIPDHEPSVVTLCRPATPDDLRAAVEMWPGHKRQRKLRTFMARFSAGYSCYVAESGGTIAAIDWVTDTDDHEGNLALVIRPRPGSCYGLDLFEHPHYQQKGIGMAVLIHCLREAAKRGCRKQFTIVQASNRKMLLTCVQLIGFTTVGRIRTRRILRHAWSTWIIEGTAGRGRVLEL